MRAKINSEKIEMLLSGKYMTNSSTQHFQGTSGKT